MDKYLVRTKRAPTPSSASSANPDSSKRTKLDEVLANLAGDPGKRSRISSYDPNIRDEVRRHYLQIGACQPILENFPQSKFSRTTRRFNKEWYKEFDWLEYSESKDAAFCLHCYLFKGSVQTPGSEAFTHVGFKNWKKKQYLNDHVGAAHNQARQACRDLMNQKQHLQTIVSQHTEQARVDYRICLTASLDCTRFLLRQGLAFRGHDESSTSSNRGNYIELLQFLADHDDKIKAVVLENAPGNLKLIAPSIQKDIVNACAIETVEAITGDMKNKLFSIMVDESRDISIKEQMAVVLRYVDNFGQVIERFVGVQHVSDTTSVSLKKVVDQLFSTNNLSISMLRGQGYDGASNMKGEFNGFKSIILRENPCAYYVHCFAHQLQLALVAVAKGNVEIATFFTSANSLVNIIGASCKRRDALRDQLQNDLLEALEDDCLVTGRGLNQETNLKRAGDTRWNSHYGTLLSIIAMFKFVVKVLDLIVDDGSTDNLGEANRSLKEHDIEVPKMDEAFVARGRSRRKAPVITNLHHYRVEYFMAVIDKVLGELNHRFNEINTELLLCMACLSSDNSFISFDKYKLVRLAKFYPQDFSSKAILELEDQLGTYIQDMHLSSEFSQLQGIGTLAKKLVETMRHKIYPLVYLLLTLALVLPVATASVERAFSAMNIVKSPLRNRMGDQWLNDSLIVYIEKDVFACIDNETIMRRFQNMKTRRGLL